MAFPGVSSATSGTNGAGTAHNIDLPANIASGNLLLIFFATQGDLSPVHDTPSGWTVLQSTNYVGNGLAFSIFYKVAAGNEGSSMQITTTANSDPSAYVVYRVTGHTGIPELSSIATNTTGTANPSGLTMAGGAKDYMWIAVGITAETISAAPSNYTDNVKIADGDSVTISVACRNLNAASEDPGSFSHTSGHWGAMTLGVNPDPLAASSESPSISPSASRSPSSSASASYSPSASLSPSTSLSPSASTSLSTSPSSSTSPSASRSPSASLSASASLSPSASSSRSLSPSASRSPSSSTSPSSSSSVSMSPSASPSPADWDNQIAHESTWTNQTKSIS